MIAFFFLLSRPADKEEPSILPLIYAGFTRVRASCVKMGNAPKPKSSLVKFFWQRFVENPSISVCHNELLLLEHGEVRLQNQLSATKALYTATESCVDAIEITNEDHDIEVSQSESESESCLRVKVKAEVFGGSFLQYINPAHERLFGYSCDEVLGKDSQEIGRSEHNKSDLIDCMNGQLRKGKVSNASLSPAPCNDECLLD